MTAQMIIPRHSSPHRRAALVALFAIVATMAFGGVVLSGLALGGAGHSAGIHEGAVLAVGAPATTSFGSLTIQRVQTLDGLDPSAFDQGMTHGIGALVAPTDEQIQIDVTLVNSSDHAATLDPRQFQLRIVGTNDPVLVTGTTIMRLELPPRASIDGTLTFVAPRGGNHMSVEFQETADSALLSIPIGLLDQAPPGASPHTH